MFNPIHATDPAPHDGDMRPTAPAPLTRFKLLVVDDHAEFRRTLRQMFENHDVSVVEAASGEEAVRSFKDARPDLAIVDMRMPGMGGLEATRAIREIDPSARVIVISQFTEAGQLERALEAGAVDFVGKEDISRLVEIVGHCTPES